MIKKKESQLKLICIVISVTLFHASHVHSLRSPYYMNGKYAATDVDTAQWSKIKTITNVVSDGQCAIFCRNSNTATEELYSDDVCHGYVYQASEKKCKLGILDKAEPASGNTKKVMLKYVDPWLVPASKKSSSCDETNTCCGLDANDASPAEDCCTDGSPCSEGEGGCQDDSNCKGDLVCGDKNCDSSHGFDADRNCCMSPIHKCRGKYATSDCCTSSNKCEEGEGHCSSDSVCGDGLKCGILNCDYSLGFKFDYNCCFKQ